MVPGCPETLIPAGKSVTIFGQLRNKRWRCAVKNGDCLNSDSETSSRTLSDVSFHENSKTRIIQEGNNKQSDCFYPLIGSIPSSIIVELNERINIVKTDHETISEDEESDKEAEYHASSSLCECGRQLSASKSSLSKFPSCSFCQYCNTPGPIQAITPDVPLLTLPESPTETTIAELNMALESLAKITTRPVSGGSDSSRSSWTSRF